MNTIQNLLTNLCGVLGCVGEVLRYAWILLRAMVCPKTVLAARLLAVESQLAVCKHRIQQKKAPRPRFTAGFRFLWLILSKSLAHWEDLAHLMQPATVKKWHTTAFRCFWRWKSRRKSGRPPISPEMQALIRKLSRENLLWGAERIRQTLLQLGCAAPGEDTVRKYTALD